MTGDSLVNYRVHETGKVYELLNQQSSVKKAADKHGKVLCCALVLRKYFSGQ